MSEQPNNPGFLVVLVDESASMGGLWEDLDKPIHEGLLESIQDWLADLSGVDDCPVAVFGYRSIGDAQAVIESWLPNGEAIMYAPALGGQNLTTRKPEANEQRPHRAALQHCLKLLQQWRAAAGTRPAAPLVYHFVSGPAPEPVDDVIEAIENLEGIVGRTVFVNVHPAPAGAGQATIFPPEIPEERFAEYLSRFTSQLGGRLAALAQGENVGIDASGSSWAMALRTRKHDVAKVLQLGVAYAASWPEKERRRQWRFPPQEETSAKLAVQFPPCAFGGLAVCLDAQLEVVDVAGRRQWQFVADSRLMAGPVRGDDGGIRVHSRSGTVSCIGDQGALLWQVKTEAPLSWARPLVDAHNNTLISAYRGGLTAIRADGSPLSDYKSPRVKFDAPGVIHEGTLYIGGDDHCLHALQLQEDSARDRWEGMFAGRTRAPIHSDVALASSYFVVASRDEFVYAFDHAGKKVWQKGNGGRLVSSPVADSQGRILVLVDRESEHENRAMLVCLASSTGQTVWEYSLAAAADAGPLVGPDDAVYCGDQSGMVHAVAPDGERIWTEQVDSPITSRGVLLGDDLLVFGLGEGRLVALRI